MIDPSNKKNRKRKVLAFHGQALRAPPCGLTGKWARKRYTHSGPTGRKKKRD